MSSRFAYNLAYDSGGAVSSRGLDGSVTLSKCKFVRNVAATGVGGAVEARASGESSLLLVIESEFVACMGYAGGGVYVGELMNAVFRGMRAIDNMAVTTGGAIAGERVRRVLINFAGKWCYGGRDKCCRG